MTHLHYVDDGRGRKVLVVAIGASGQTVLLKSSVWTDFCRSAPCFKKSALLKRKLWVTVIRSIDAVGTTLSIYA